jgi:hypothetical protein
LVAVTASANRSKGDRSPDQWMPPNRTYWCQHVEDWVSVKTRWALSITSVEHDALAVDLVGCQ